MIDYRELSDEACALLARASAGCRARQIVVAKQSASRAVTLINDAITEIERRLRSLTGMITTTPRVLCVDDNRDIADSTVELFRAVGVDARACYSGIAALTETVAFRPTLCLIDLNMPGMDGDKLAIRLRAQSQRLKLLAVTAMDDAKSRERIKTAGFDLHLVKPVDPERLLALVESCKWMLQSKAS